MKCSSSLGSVVLVASSACLVSLLWACSSGDASIGPDVSGDAAATEPEDGGSGGDGATEDGAISTEDGAAGDGGVGPKCVVPVDLAPIVNPVVVGTGTAASCTEAALKSAIATASAASRPVTFACGGPATITLTQEITLTTGKPFTIDGKNEITIDGAGKTRLFKYSDGNFRSPNASLLSFQRLTLANGKSTGTKLETQATGKCSRGFRTDASGGAIYARNARLHVVDVVFKGNKTETLGPDVAGGAVYAIGSVDTTIVRSRFEDNLAANGGAIGSLFGGLRVYDSTFTNNRTTGFGGNGISNDCPAQADGQKQVGSGGLGGGIYADGAEKHTLVLCGVHAKSNQGSSLGGFMFRVGYDSGQGLDVDLSSFTDNSCDGKSDDGYEEGSAGAIYVQQQPVSIKRSTFARNRARALGAGLRFDFNSAVTMENVTVVGNTLSGGAKSRNDGSYGGLIGGGIFWSTTKPGAIKSSTIAGNTISGAASGGFGAAISDPGGQVPAALRIDDSIIANNTAPNNGVGMQCQHTASQGANNVQWPRKRANGTTDDTACVAGVTFADPQLAPLAGDPEVSVPGAAAVVQTGASCPATDQRGRTRSTPCTLGAVER